MRAMVIERIVSLEVDDAPLRLVDLPMPEPAAGEVRLRVAACGVCRTDLQLVEGDLPARRLPIVPGHQVVGRVSWSRAAACLLCAGR